LETAEHKISLLVKSVKELEEAMARLLTYKQVSTPTGTEGEGFVQDLSAKSK
jgi:hypothetical protein